MTLSEITTEVRNITGVDSTSVLADSIIHDLINEGHFQLCDEANLLQGYATRNSVVDTSEYQMKDTNTLVTDWTLSQNNLDGAISTSLSLESMTRIYRVEYDGSICQRIGINEINDIPDDEMYEGLYNHQKKSLAFGFVRQHYADLSDCGTGKTIASLAVVNKINKDFECSRGLRKEIRA